MALYVRSEVPRDITVLHGKVTPEQLDGTSGDSGSDEATSDELPSSAEEREKTGASSSDEGPNILNGFLGKVRAPVDEEASSSSEDPAPVVETTKAAGEQQPAAVTQRTPAVTFTCTVCFKVYTSRKWRYRHMDQVHRVVIPEDDLAVQAASAKKRSVGAKSAEEKKKPGVFPCDQCEEAFPSVNERNNHVTAAHSVVHDTQHASRGHSCPECGAHFTRKREFEAHRKREHQQQRLPKTDEKRLSEMRGRYAVKQQQKREKVLEELFPKRTFEENLSERSDKKGSPMLRIGGFTNDTKHICSVCGFLGESKSRMQSHFYAAHIQDMACQDWMAAYVKSGAAVIAESVSDVSASSGSDVSPAKKSRLDAGGVNSGSSPNGHVWVNHETQNKDAAGPAVILNSPSFPQAVQPFVDHSSPTGKRYECPAPGCQVVCSHSSSWNLHVRKIHPELMNFPCKLCGKLFFRESGLSTHLKRCDKSASRTSDSFV